MKYRILWYFEKKLKEIEKAYEIENIAWISFLWIVFLIIILIQYNVSLSDVFKFKKKEKILQFCTNSTVGKSENEKSEANSFDNNTISN